MVGFHFETGSNHRNPLILDQHIGPVIINRGYNAAILDKSLHRFLTTDYTDLILVLEARFGGGSVGGATGVLVLFWTWQNFVGDADFCRSDLGHGQIPR
jgi:hypothetical protein